MTRPRTSRASILGSLAAALLLLGAPSSCSAVPAPAAIAPGSAVTTQPIAWRAFDEAAFEQARLEDKLVLVDVGIEGCTACRWMYQETYQDAAVARRVREHFVAVSVDADVQPDLGARFEAWGWPATIAMTPDGAQVLALRGSRAPEVFARILDDLVRRKKTGALRAGGATATAPSAPAKRSALREACLGIARRFDADMNREHGGWSDEGPQYVLGPAIEWALLRARVEARPDLRDHALQTLEGWSKMLDPVWGGIYVAAHEVDFSGAIVEKRLVQEAEALRSFAAAYAATRDPRWRHRAAEIDRYLVAFLLAPDGTFYSTQQDEAPGLPAGMSAADYFELSDAERRKYGVPPVDHAVYTDQNGQAIEAYAMLYEATGEPGMLSRATRAADALLSTRLDPAGFVRQAAPSRQLDADARKRAFRPLSTAYLTAQARFAEALVALHRVTGEARWLDAARSIVSAARVALEDRALGGFFASPADARVAGAEKPVLENVVMARVLHSLAVYDHDERMDGVAERTLRGVGASRGALVALAVHELALGPVEISIAGAPSDPRAAALYRAALDVHEPRKALHWDTARRYPDRGRPALYVCTRSSCSSPVHEPSGVAAAVAAATEARRSACE